MKARRFSLVLLFAIFIYGCSSGAGGINPGEPGSGIRDAASGKSNLMLCGFYTVTIDRSSGEVDLVPHRRVQGALNVLGFMEPPPLEDLTIDFDSLEIDPAGNYVGVDVILTHPMDDSFFTGFEVRGVVFGPEVTNADGATRWLNPAEFSSLPWGYQDGLLGAPDYYAHYDHLYNDYKLFTDSYPDPVLQSVWNGEPWYDGDVDPLDTSFQAGESKSAHYDLDFGDDPGDFLIFNYAILANYAFPPGDGPWAPEDFPVNAHCPEPFMVAVEMYENDSFWDPPYGAGGTMHMGVRVFDWVQPEGNSALVSIPGLGINNASPISYTQDSGNELSWVFEFELNVTTGSGVGFYPMFVSVTDAMTYGEGYFLDGMGASHPLYNEPISMSIETQAKLNGTDIFVDPYVIGYLTYDDTAGEGKGHAMVDIRVDWPGIGVNSVELDASALGKGVMIATATKGEGNYIFHLDNDAGVTPGDINMGFTVHFSNFTDFNDIVLLVIHPFPWPPGGPLNSIPVAHPEYGGIGTIYLDFFKEATCGVNMGKHFEPNSTTTDCAEYRWIQVITTDAPIHPAAGNSYVDPWPNDDPLGIPNPYYWTDGEAADANISSPFGTPSAAFSDGPRRPKEEIPPNPDPTTWHAELILVCVRPGLPDVLLHSETYWFQKHSDGTVDSGIADGVDGGSEHARDVLRSDFGGYLFE